MTQHDDHDDEKPSWIHPGDLGTILLAAVFMIGMLFMVFGPSPFKGIFDKKPEAARDNGVVTVTVPPKE
jgi:hypothetical protein